MFRVTIVTTIDATINGYPLELAAKRLVYVADGAITCFELYFSDVTAGSALAPANSTARVGINGVELLRGYVDDRLPEVSDEQTVFEKEAVIKGRGYGRDLAFKFLSGKDAKIVDVPFNEFVAEAIQRASCYLITSVGDSNDFPSVACDIDRTYLIDAFNEAASKSGCDFRVTNERVCYTWPIAKSPDSGITLKSVAGANDNNILTIKSPEISFDLKNSIRVDSGNLNDHWTELNCSDYRASYDGGNLSTGFYDDTTRYIAGKASIRARVTAGSDAQSNRAINIYLRVADYGHDYIDLSDIAEVSGSIWTICDMGSGQGRELFLYLRDDAGHDAYPYALTNNKTSFRKFDFKLGADYTIGQGSPQAQPIPAGFTWRLTRIGVAVQLYQVSSVQGYVWFDGLSLDGVAISVVSKDQASITAYAERMLPLSRTDVRSQRELQQIADVEVLHRKDPLKTMTLTCTYQPNLLYTGYLVNVLVPDLYVGNGNSAVKYRVLSIRHEASPGVPICRGYDAVTILELAAHGEGISIDRVRSKLSSSSGAQPTINIRYGDRIEALEKSFTGSGSLIGGLSSSGGGGGGGYGGQGVFPLFGTHPKITNYELIDYIWGFENGAWMPTAKTIPQGESYIHISDTGLSLGVDVFEIIVDDENGFAVGDPQRYSPLLGVSTGLVVKKDIACGGFVSANQGKISLGSGLVHPFDPPGAWLNQGRNKKWHFKSSSAPSAGYCHVGDRWINTSERHPGTAFYSLWHYVSTSAGWQRLNSPATTENGYEFGNSLPVWSSSRENQYFIRLSTRTMHLWHRKRPSDPIAWADLGSIDAVPFEGFFDTFEILRGFYHLQYPLMPLENYGHLKCDTVYAEGLKKHDGTDWLLGAEGSYAGKFDLTGTVPTYTWAQLEPYMWGYSGNNWTPNDKVLPLGESYLRFNEPSSHYIDIGLIYRNESGTNPVSAHPIIWVSQHLFIKKDVGVGGMLNVMQGALSLGHGLDGIDDPPKILLGHSGSAYTGNNRNVLHIQAYNQSNALVFGHAKLDTLYAEHLKKHDGTDWLLGGGTNWNGGTVTNNITIQREHPELHLNATNGNSAIVFYKETAPKLYLAYSAAYNHLYIQDPTTPEPTLIFRPEGTLSIAADFYTAGKIVLRSVVPVIDFAPPSLPAGQEYSVRLENTIQNNAGWLNLYGHLKIAGDTRIEHAGDVYLNLNSTDRKNPGINFMWNGNTEAAIILAGASFQPPFPYLYIYSSAIILSAPSGLDIRAPIMVNSSYGTSGQILTSNGLGNQPSWQTPGSGPGGWNGGTVTDNITIQRQEAQLRLDATSGNPAVVFYRNSTQRFSLRYVANANIADSYLSFFDHYTNLQVAMLKHDGNMGCNGDFQVGNRLLVSNSYGSSGQVLTSNGNNPPTWQTPGTGGGGSDGWNGGTITGDNITIQKADPQLHLTPTSGNPAIYFHNTTSARMSLRYSTSGNYFYLQDEPGNRYIARWDHSGDYGILGSFTAGTTSQYIRIGATGSNCYIETSAGRPLYLQPASGNAVYATTDFYANNILPRYNNSGDLGNGSTRWNGAVINNIYSTSVMPLSSNSGSVGNSGTYWNQIYGNTVRWKSGSTFSCTPEESGKDWPHAFSDYTQAAEKLTHESTKNKYHIIYAKENPKNIVCTCGKIAQDPCPEHQAEWEDLYTLNIDHMVYAASYMTLEHAIEITRLQYKTLELEEHNTKLETRLAAIELKLTQLLTAMEVNN